VSVLLSSSGTNFPIFFAVAIPETINGLPVTSIGDAAFAHCTLLTSATIPNTVTGIGNMAFSATGLTNVTIIEEDAFSDCGNLPSVGIAPKTLDFGRTSWSDQSDHRNILSSSRLSGLDAGKRSSWLAF
jgi:hypothetical protein